MSYSILFSTPLPKQTTNSGCLLLSLACREGNLSSQQTAALLWSALSKPVALTQRWAALPHAWTMPDYPSSAGVPAGISQENNTKITGSGLRHGDGEQGEGNEAPSSPQTQGFFVGNHLNLKLVGCLSPISEI